MNEAELRENAGQVAAEVSFELCEMLTMLSHLEHTDDGTQAEVDPFHDGFSF